MASASKVRVRIWLRGAIVFVTCGRARILSIMGWQPYTRCGNWHCLLGIMWKGCDA
jgi:hypothetical protein